MVRKTFGPLSSICLFLLFFCAALEAAPKKDPAVYAVYLTWRESADTSPATSMVVQWVTVKNDRHDDVEYRKLGDSTWIREEGRHKSMPEDLPYMIHRNELMDLQPDTVYEFRVGDRQDVYKLRTMPEKLTTPLRFVVGGDMYHDEMDVLRETNRRAALTNPAFVLIGGDIAYAANGGTGFLPSFITEIFDRFAGQDSQRWLEWLKAWSQDMVTRDGILIPMIPAIGNHDVNGRFDQTPDEAVFFYTLFAYPGRQGYGVLDFGKYLSILTMDSGHTHSVGGKQTDWLEETLDTRQNVPWKVALYHVPAFPSYRKLNNTVSSKIRGHWVPLFEEYGLTVAFESHDHTYKRTHHLRDGSIDPNGVLYVGDGAWGISKPREPHTPEERWYLAKTAAERHFIAVTVATDRMDIEAIASDTGSVIDRTTIFR